MYKRIMISSPSSSSGKTTIMLALLALLKDKGIDISSFKCGPDYIDPMFHEKIIGIPSQNLDMFFAGEIGIKKLLSSDLENSSYALIEGAMGLYDGLGGVSSLMSAYDIALATKTPVVVVLDASGIGRTIISLIKGILADDLEKLICGIILNKVSKSFYAQIAPVIENETGIKCLGYFPKMEEAIFESRHLGLKLPNEIKDYQIRIKALAAEAANTIDVDRIIAIMDEAEPLELNIKEAVAYKTLNELKLAVAMDEVFCFYYKENFEEFKKRNIKIVPFSPLHDRKLPSDISAIYLGGGYPELRLKELSDNIEMKRAIREAINSNIPCLAECGGFMYLHEGIISDDGKDYEMVGAISGKCYNTKKLGRFGYIDLYLNKNFIIKAHEFHYYDSENPGADCIAKKPTGNRQWECMHMSESHLWGFAHLYYPSCPAFLDGFVKQMELYEKGKVNL